MGNEPSSKMDSSSFDEATVSKVATLVSRALNQPTTNRVFARRVIDCGAVHFASSFCIYVLT